MPCHLPDANSLVNSQNLFIFVLTVCKEKSKVCSAFGPSEEEGYLNMLDRIIRPLKDKSSAINHKSSAQRLV